jgi:hypothetical protein
MGIKRVTFDADRQGRFSYNDPVVLVYPRDKIS